ncbi:MAG: alpha/beta hydrolase [Bacteroidota bacterium]
MRYFILFILIVTLISCRKRLDGFLFNNSEISTYELDEYTGETSLTLPDGYEVPATSIYQFQYAIDDQGENLSIQARYVGDTSTIDQDTVILYCHGNRDHMDYYWSRQKLLSHIGQFGRYGVLMFDYPGYGLSEGEPTEENMYASAAGALKWLKKKGLETERLVMYGFSLGSAPVCEVASATNFPLQPNKIILEAPFASSEVMVQDASVVAMPGSFFTDAKINNADKIKQSNVPLLWMHGKDDDFLSIETHGSVVYDHHQGPWKSDVRVDGADHEGVPVFMGAAEYNALILDFITTPN